MAKRLSKAEIAEQEQCEAERAMRIAQALRWTGPTPAPDVAPPDTHGLTTGYMFNVYAQYVEVACSSSVSHAIGRTDRTTSQRPLHLYSTRLLALRALRAESERKFAEQLAKIDEQIEAERRKGGEKR